MRILCALHAHLGLVAALRRFPELRNEPVILGEAAELRLPVIAATPAALAHGVRPGQPLRHAQQLCPGAAFARLDPEATARLREGMCAALHRLAPAVEVGDGEVFCDVSGQHAVHRDEPAWATAIARAVAATLDAGPPAVGVAGSRLVARLAALRSEPGRIRRVRGGEEAGFLAPLPLESLPLDPAVAARLAAFGLDCLGAVARLSPAELQRQFGPDGALVHRLVRGEDGEGVRAGTGEQTWSERLVLEGGVGDLEVLLRAARHCTEALGARLDASGLAAGHARLVYEVEGGPPLEAAEVAPAPASSAAGAWPLVLGLLGRLQPSCPVTAVRLELTRLMPAGGRQTDMLRPGDASRDAVAGAAVRLRARFGDTAARRPRLALDPGDLPERRYVWEAPTLAAAARG
ncbi:MAG: hypothetical protein JOZ46_11610 [Candidatus Dormibacteraeota bacterium]|nr:hypothetical protein [Candidatus Dormibacteraeota bacterium]MBV9526449.1 hypothetical protein [Candidatus Dormibacteraeota bacterium]